MKIAVISDIHENAHNLLSAVEQIMEWNCDIIFCLWDMGSSRLFEVLFISKLPVYFTFGNHDGNVIRDTKMLLKNKWIVRSCGFYQKIELGERKIFLTHYDDLAKTAAKSWEFDACFGWHLHRAFEIVSWDTLCVNPGEITGTNEEPRFYVYDTKTNSGEYVFVRDPHYIDTPKVKEFYKMMKI